MLRTKTIFAAVTFAALFPACSSKKGGTTDPGLDAMFGTYGLISINALAVPVTVSLTSTKKVEIMSSTLIVNSSGSFTNATTYRTTENGVATTKTETCGGNYLVHQSTLSFSENVVTNTTCGSRYSGLWNGVNVIAVDFDPTTHAVFSK